MNLPFDKHSRSRLTHYNLKIFPSEKFHDRLARVVCRAGCLPRKEFYETWEVVKRIRRRFRDRRVVELAAGHGFLAALMVLVEKDIPSALCTDITKPPSHDKLMEALVAEWPRLKGRVNYEKKRIAATELTPDSLAVSVHACGGLTDEVIDRALEARAAVAVLPCCQSFAKCDDAGLSGWMEGTLAIDAARAARLSAAGYRVVTTTIPEEITPKNRLLMGWPA